MYHDLNMHTAYIPSVVSWLSFATNRVRSASPLTCLLQQSGRREAKRWVQGLSQSRDQASSHGLVIARTTARSWGMLSVPSMLPAFSGSYSPYSIATGAQKRLPEPQSSPFSAASSILLGTPSGEIPNTISVYFRIRCPYFSVYHPYLHG